MDVTEAAAEGGRPGRPLWTSRSTAWLTLAAASGIAGVTSYAHALVVVQAADGHTWWSLGQPALTDLVIVGASAAILDRLRAGRKLPVLPLLSLLAGIGMTMVFNLAVSDPAAVPKWLVNGWTAVAFLAALESVLSIIRRGQDGEEPAAAAEAQPGASQPEPPPLHLADAVRAARAHGVSRNKLAVQFEISRYRVSQILGADDDPAELAADLAGLAAMNGASA